MKSTIEQTEIEELVKLPGEKSRVGVYILQDGKFCYINPSFPIVTGYPADELIGRDALDIVVPEDRKMVRENAIKMLKGKLLSPYYFRVICKDGSIKWLMETVRSIQFQGRRATLGDYMEITVRKQAEEALKESEERYRELANSITDVFFAMDDHLRYTYWNKASEILTGIRAEAALGKSLQEIFPDTSGIRKAEKVYRDVLRTQQSQTFVTYYTDHDGRHYIFEISAYPSRNGISVFVKDITERKKTEKALLDSEERYRALFDRSLDCVYVHDFEGNFLDANKTAMKLLGYKREDILHLNFASLLSQDQLPTALATVQELKDTGIQKHINEFRLRCKDGSFVDVETISALIYHEGKPYAIQGVARDVTKRKQTEEALQKSEEKYRLLSENASDVIWTTDMNLKFTYASPSVEKLLGYTPEEFTSFTIDKTLTPPSLELAMRVFQEELAIEQLEQKDLERTRTIESELVCKDGSTVWVEVKMTFLRDEAGHPTGILGIARNITERKHAEDELKKSEERYRQLAENAGEAILVVQDGMIRFSNPKGAELSGYSIEELTSKPFVEFIYPDDSAMVADHYLRRLKGDTLPQTYDFRVTRKDGAIRWAELNAVLISWDNRPAVLCFMSDITDRKKAEEELRIKDTALASSVNAVAMADMEGNLAYVNNAFLNWWGYKDKKQVLGKPSTGFWQVVNKAEEVQKAVQKKGGWTGELSAKRKDGTFFDVQLSSSLVKNKTGKPICMMASFADITERKRTEEALRQSEENYRTLFDNAVIGTIVLDAETMKVLMANQAAVKIFGFSSAGEIFEADPFDFILPEDKEKVTELAEKALFEQNAQLTYELGAVTKDGREIWISATGARIVHEGRLAGLISFTDITEKKQQTERFMLADRLASIGELAAGAAHELNNPLTSVIGFSQLLMERDISDDIRQDLTFIYSEAQRAASITKNLLAFARKHKPMKRLNQINEIIEDVLKLRTYEHKIHDIKVEKQLAPDLPESMVDYFQIQQVFFNIVINAEYFMTEAHKRGTLTITTEKQNGTVITTFTDDGPGIPLENLSQIFNPFFTTKATGKGTGLGLSICHGVVSEHGGKIHARSQPGEGTTIFIELPINGSQPY